MPEDSCWYYFDFRLVSHYVYLQVQISKGKDLKLEENEPNNLKTRVLYLIGILDRGIGL